MDAAAEPDLDALEAALRDSLRIVLAMLVKPKSRPRKGGRRR